MNNTKKIKTPVAIITIIISILMLTGVALAASHEQSAVWENTGNTSFEVPPNEDIVTTITITNDSGDSIENIQIVGDISPGPTVDLSAGENFYTDNLGRRLANENVNGTYGYKVQANYYKDITLNTTSDNRVLGVVDLIENQTQNEILRTDYHAKIINKPNEIRVWNLTDDNFTVDNVIYYYENQGTVFDLAGSDNLVLPAGTELQLRSSRPRVMVYENTEMKLNDETQLWFSATGENWYTLDNEWLEADNSFKTFLSPGDNIATVKEQEENFTPVHGAKIKLTEDTQVIATKNREVVKLPEDTEFELHNTASFTNNALKSGDNVKLLQDNLVNLNDNWQSGTGRTEDNALRALYQFNVKAKDGSLGVVDDGDKVYPNEAVLENGTVVGLTGSITADILENTPVIRGADNELEMENTNAATILPEDWGSVKRSNHYVFGTPYLEFWTSSDYTLDSGESLDIPIALSTGSDDTNVRVRTTDTTGATRQTTLTLEPDTTNPEVKDLTVSPKFAGENVEVDIEIEFTEPLAVDPDVTVTEKNVRTTGQVGENVSIDLTTDNNNLVYEGTYTTGENVKRDGAATILIENFEDDVGNPGVTYKSPGDMFTITPTGGFSDLNLSAIETADNYLLIDRAEPLTPNLNENIHGWPEDETASENKHTDKTDYLWEAMAKDNMQTLVKVVGSTRFDGSAGVKATPLFYGNVELLYEGEWHSIAADSDGYWSFEKELPDGRYEIGVRYTDLTGNTSTENVENFVIDDTAPTIDLTSDFDDEGYVSENQPEIAFNITDEGVGIDNKQYALTSDVSIPVTGGVFGSEDNSGYIVRISNDLVYNSDLNEYHPQENTQVYNVEEEQIENYEVIVLRNDLPHDRHVLDFSNSLENILAADMASAPSILKEAQLPDGTYDIAVKAGDNLQHGKELYTFTVDTVVPVIEGLVNEEYMDVEDSDGAQLDLADVTNNAELTYSGKSNEAESTIYLYDSDGNVLGSTTASSEKEWEITVTLPEGRNYVYVQEEDLAGNMSEQQLAGQMIVDTEAPMIEFSQDTKDVDGTETSRSTILLEATITDAVAEYDEITTALSGTGYYTPESPVKIAEDGTIAREIPLREGVNTLTLIADDAAGNRAVETITITRTVTPWTMYATIAAIIAIILAAIAILRRT